MTDFLDPRLYGPGKSGEQITWLRERLDAHGFPLLPLWDHSDQERVAAFQRKQGWTGTGADGIPGPQTLKRLALPPVTATLPSKVLDLLRWKLTLPYGAAGNPTEIKQPELAYFRDSRYFFVGPDGAVEFIAPCGGVTTSHSGYPRCELREMDEDEPTKLASWSSRSGVHTLTATMAIRHLPIVKPETVCAQIHDAIDDIVMVRLEGDPDDPHAFKRLFVESDGEDMGTLDPDYRFNDKFDLDIVATSAGISVRYENYRSGRYSHVEYERTGSGWYFKAGDYTQSNVSKGDAATAFGHVAIYALNVSHS